MALSDSQSPGSQSPGSQSPGSPSPDGGGGGGGGNENSSKSDSKPDTSIANRRGLKAEDDTGLAGTGKQTGTENETPTTPQVDRRATAATSFTETEEETNKEKPSEPGFFNSFKEVAKSISKAMPEQPAAVKLAANLNQITKAISLAYSGFRGYGQPEATEAEKAANKKSNYTKAAVTTTGTLLGINPQVTGFLSDLAGMKATGELSNNTTQTNTPGISRRNTAVNAFTTSGDNNTGGFTAGETQNNGFQLSNFDPSAYASHVSGMQANNPNSGLLFTT